MSRSIFLACEFGDLAQVRRLIEGRRADVDEVSAYGLTPLQIACASGNFNIVHYLVQNRADITIGDPNGMRPLHVACTVGNRDIVQCLLERGGTEYANVTNWNGVTPLFMACAVGHLDVVKCLIQHGAADTATKHGATPLYIASQEGHYRIVQYLVQCGGANIKAATNDVAVALRIANSNGLTDLEYLFGYGGEATETSESTSTSGDYTTTNTSAEEKDRDITGRNSSHNSSAKHDNSDNNPIVGDSTNPLHRAQPRSAIPAPGARRAPPGQRRLTNKLVKI